MAIKSGNLSFYLVEVWNLIFPLKSRICNRVRAVMENLEKSWNLNYRFPGLEKSWKSLKMSEVMEKSWKIETLHKFIILLFPEKKKEK